MKIKTKILCTLLGMCLLVALMGAFAVERQHTAAMVGVTKEAEDVSRVLSLIFTSDKNKATASAQEIVARLHQTQGRDVTVVDINQLILADAHPSDIGKIYSDDPQDEIGATIKDRKVRAFVEVSHEYPMGIKQIVVPIEGESGQVLGAVVLEYTPLYDELMRLTRNTAGQLVLAGCASAAIAFLIAFFMGRSISRPLQQLTNMATEFAAGRTDSPMPTRRKDEIGELATAFINMVHKREQAENDLRSMRDELELRVVERTIKWAESNEALQAKNSERARVEKTLRESEEKFRQLAENITDVFWMSSPDLQQFLYISPVYEKIWGRSTESLYSNPRQWVESILPEDRERVFSVFAGLGAGKSSVSVEYQISRPDGTIRWLHDRGFVVRDAAGRVIRLAGIVSDITERKQAEDARRASEGRYRALFENAPDGIVIANPESYYVDANKSMCQMLGYTRDELIGLHASDVVAQTELQHIEPALNEIKARPDYHREWQFRRKDGSVFAAEVIATLLPDGNILGMVRDISERKQAEARLENTHRELLDASRMAGKAEMATGVLHNVGNVINSVNVASTCIADSIRKSKAANLSKIVGLLREHEADLGAYLTDDPKGRQIPTYLAQLAERLSADHVGVLKGLAELEKNIEHIKEVVTVQQSSAKGIGKAETLQATDLVEDILRMDSAGQSSRDIQIIREFASVPAITVEKHKVLQILMNLVRNAKEACQETGGLDKRLTIRVTNGEDRVRIAVSDNGVGISPGNLTRIFAHGFTTKKDGHGFGLHSAVVSAKEMGGALNVHSDGLGKGATFTLELPVAR